MAVYDASKTWLVGPSNLLNQYQHRAIWGPAKYTGIKYKVKPPSDVSWFIHPINNSAIGQPSYRTGASMELRKWLVIISSKKWPAMKNHVFQKMLYVFLWWFLIVGVSIMCVYGCVSISSCVSKELLILEVSLVVLHCHVLFRVAPDTPEGGKWADKQVQGEAPQIDKLTYTLVH